MTDRIEPSRREFLAASALGLLGIMQRPANFASTASAPAGALLYVGTYTEGRSEGIHLVRFDTQSGELRLESSVDAGPNPSFLTIHPNGSVLYAVNEVDNLDDTKGGGVSAFRIDAAGALTGLNSQASEGTAPCYVSVDRTGHAALVANYSSGTIAVFPLGRDGSLVPASQVVQHVGHGPNAERQEGPHAHCITADPSNQYALAVDLGVDQVLVYRMDPVNGTLRHVDKADASLRPGAGPRHLAFHPRRPVAYVANELDSTIAMLRFDAASGALSVIATRSTLPAGTTAANFPADIHVSPSGRSLYVSNRGHNSIAVFRVDPSTGLPTSIQHVSTGGDWPRNFALDPSGRWLLVANQRSGSIVVLARDPDTGRLSPTTHSLAVASPVCLRFRQTA